MALILGVSVAAGLVEGPRPTVTAVGDVISTTMLVVLLVAAGSRATPRAWTVAGVIAAVGALGSWILVLAAGVVVIGLVTPSPRRGVTVDLRGAFVGGCLAQVVLRLPTDRVAVNLAVSTAVVLTLVMSAAGRGAVRDQPRRRLAGVVGGLVAVPVVAVALATAIAARHLEDAVERAERGLESARSGDDSGAADHLEAAAGAFARARDDLDAWWTVPARALPVVGQQVDALEQLSTEGSELAGAGASVARQTRLDELTVTEGRIDPERVRSMARPIGQLQDALSEAADGVADVRSPWLLPPIADRVRSLERSIDAASLDAGLAADIVDVVPAMLGGDGPRTYFVAFGTPAESRELGGFMGAYGVLGAVDGRLELRSTGRVRNLNTYFTSGFAEPSRFPDAYLAQLPQRFWHNMTGTPDFPTMAEAVRERWRVPSGERVDGVLYLDPGALAALLRLTGPIRLEGRDEPLNARNAAAFLLREQYVEYPDDDRHDFLVEAAETVFDDLTSTALPPAPEVFDVLSPSVQGRRVMLHSFHPREQRVLGRIGVDGALPEPVGDLLSVRSSNRGLNKVDAFLQRSVSYSARIDPATGRVSSTASITIRNDAPRAGLPRTVLENRLGQPDGTSSMTLAVYSPLELVELTVDGDPAPRASTPAYGMLRHSVLVDIPPRATMTIELELAGTLDLSEGYQLSVVPQALVAADELTVDLRATDGWAQIGRSTEQRSHRKTVQMHLDFVRFG